MITFRWFRLATLLGLLGMSVALAACENTIRGVGADAREADNAVRDVAQ